MEPADVYPPRDVHHRILGSVQAHGDGTRARHHDPLRACHARSRHGLRKDARPPPWNKPFDYELLDAFIQHQLEEKGDVTSFWRPQS